MIFEGFPVYKILEHRFPNLYPVYAPAHDFYYEFGVTKTAECIGREYNYGGCAGNLKDCTHGIHGGYSFERVVADYLWADNRVVALFELYGEIILGEMAAKAEKGKLIAIVARI